MLMMMMIQARIECQLAGLCIYNTTQTNPMDNESVAFFR